MMTTARVRVNPNCGTLRCEPGWSWRPQERRFADFDLWYVWAGRGEMRTPDAVYPLRPGSLLCLRPGRDYTASHDPARRLGVSYLHFEFIEPRTKVRAAPAPLPPVCVEAGEMEWVEQTLRHAVRLRQSSDPTAHEQSARLVEAVILSMRIDCSSRLSPLARQHRDAIATIVRYVRENPSEWLSVAELAARAGYGVDHFTRLFLTHVGKTPKAFCIAVRTERAGHLLRESAMTVEQVARDLGYGDVYFFSRQFKQRTGVSPTTWRRSAATSG